MNEVKSHGIGSFLLGLSLSFVIFSFSISQIRFWDDSFPILIGAFRYSFLFVFLPLFAAGLFLRKKEEPLFSPSGVASGLLLVFFSDWVGKYWGFLWQDTMRGEILLFTLLAYVYLKKYSLKLTPLLVLISLILLTTFLVASEGKVIFSDDHGPVFFRLSLLKDNFPFIPIYYPGWNAGLDARDFFATGILNLFILFFPLIKLFELTSVYTLCVGLVLFVVVPAAQYFAVRIHGYSKDSAAFAGILGLVTSILWYRWGLKYGSMGFVTSAALFPLTISVLMHFIEGKETARRFLLFALFFCTLTFCWSMSIVALLPLALFGLAYSKEFFKTKTNRIFFFILILINIYPAVMLSSVSKVGKFLTIHKENVTSEMRDSGLEVVKTTAAVKSASKGDPKKSFREYIISCSPVLLFFSLPGFFLIRERRKLVMLVTLSLWLLLLGTVLKAMKPQLELDRMLILLGITLVYPASILLEKLKKESTFFLAMTLSFLFLGVISVVGVINNRSPEHFTWLDEEVTELSDAIKTNANGGRVVFLGFVLHELNRGHLAPLSVFTHEPLVASSPFHNKWRYTGVVPNEFLKKDEQGIEEFLDLQAASTVIAHEDEWIQYLKKHPERYKRVWKSNTFEMFERNAPINYFLEGEGSVLEQSDNNVALTLSGTHAVIKFQYFSFLESSQCKLSEKIISKDIRFIELSSCDPKEPVILRAKTGFSRVIAEELS